MDPSGVPAHHYLPPLAANVALRLLVYLTILTAGFALVKREYGTRCALLCCLLLGANSYLLRAIGSDYVEAPVVAYSFVALEELGAAAFAFNASGTAAGCIRALLAGAAYAAAIHTNTFMLVLAPAFAVSFVFRVGWKELVWKAAAAALGGAALCTLYLGIFSKQAGGPFWFFLASILHMQRQTHTPNPWHYAMSVWIAGAGWVVLPWAIGIVAAFWLWRRRKEAGAHGWRADLFALLTALAISAALHVFDEPVFQTETYTEYSTPFVFAAAAAIVGRRLDAFSTAEFGALAAACAGAALMAGTQSVKTSSSGGSPPHLSYLSTLTVAGAVPGYLTLVLAGILSAELIRRRWAVVLPAVALGAWFVALTFAVKARTPDRNSAKALFLTVHEAKLRLSQYSRERPLYFWYRGDPLATASPWEDRYVSIASTYLYEYRLLSSNLPDTSAFRPRNLPKQFRIALLARKSKEIEEAMAALKRAGVEASPLARWNAVQPSYLVDVVDVVLRRLPEWYLLPAPERPPGSAWRWVKDWSGADLPQACELNFYGGVPEKIPGGPPSAIFKVTDPKDHVATRFIPIGDAPGTGVRFEFDVPDPKVEYGSVRLVVNDQKYRTIYDSGTMFEPRRGVTIAVPQDAKSIRVTFLPNDEGYIVLAARVKIGMANSR